MATRKIAAPDTVVGTERLSFADTDSDERRMSVQLTYLKSAKGAVLTVFVFNRAANHIEGHGVPITLDASGAGEFHAAAGSTYRISCWFQGNRDASIKVVVSYPADMQIGKPAAELSPAQSRITAPGLGSNKVRLMVPDKGGLR